MQAEHVLVVAVKRHILDTDRSFDAVLNGSYEGISQPDIAALFAQLATSQSYDQFSSLVHQAEGTAGLMRFMQLDLDVALTLAPDADSRRLVRLIAGNPVTMGQITRHVPDAGSYAPVTIRVEETIDRRTRVAYDTVTSAIDPYHNDNARAVAERLDDEVMTLLRHAASPQSGPTD